MSSVLKKSKRSGTPKKVIVGGGAILLLGILMGMFMDPPGLGSGTMVMKGSESAPPVASDEPLQDVETVDNSLYIAGFITVLIDDRSYAFVKKVDDELVFEAAELPAIVEQATKAPGNEDGIQVRVLRRPSARYSAETNLRMALADGGIAREAIYMSKAFVE